MTLEKSDVYIRNTLIDIYREGQRPLLPPDQTKPWVLNVSLDVLGELPHNAGLKYALLDSSKKKVASGDLKECTQSKGVIGGSTTIEDGTVDLWWPVGMGPQSLYYLEVEITGTSNKASVTKRTGFRTIVLNALPISDVDIAKGIAPGNNWHFEINGKEFYAKGSVCAVIFAPAMQFISDLQQNFIPPDAFWPRVTPERMEKLFDSVILGNQNMLRVWSSGAYSPDYMFDLADGISFQTSHPIITDQT